jgi:hypothetical protein
MHEAIQCEELSDRYTEFWIYRSLVPSLVPDDFNRGPFVVGHGHLDRSAILVNDNFELTGVINWEWSMTEPLQVAAIIPPFLAHIPNFDPGSELCRQFYGHYINALKAYERHFRSIQLPGTKLAPVISDLVRHGVIFQFIGSVARCADLDMSESLWMNVFSPTFGEIDRALFMDMFRNAPGVLDEFKRTRAFLQQREVHP